MIKYFYIIIFIICAKIGVFGQEQEQLEKIVLTSKKGKTEIKLDNQDILYVNVSTEDSIKFYKNGFVSYHDFGAQGDGKTDDLYAISATHAYANRNKLAVKETRSSNYYIGGKNHSVIIQTNTDFGTAKFIIDDRNVENIKTPVFIISSSYKTFKIKNISSLKKNQKKLKINLPKPSIITVKNSNVKHYIRFGLNQDNGDSQTDILLVDEKGTVDMNSQILWDFNTITDIYFLPIDDKILTVKGGFFTTIANNAESKYNYYSRNFLITRSNLVIDGITHFVKGEGDQGAPYRGFINIVDCANVTVKNALFTPHKTYKTIGSAGKPVSMGSYDISVNRSLNVSFINCSQTIDINDKNYWGIFASNYSKNILFDGCVFSRFDAHKGVANATIKNCTIGYMGIRAIGSGCLTIENTTITGENIVTLRQDYGSTWQGKVFIKNCVFSPASIKHKSNLELIGGFYSGEHYFGYSCYMPELIVIDNLKINDSKFPEDYKGPFIFKDFNPKFKDVLFKEVYPYFITKKVVIKNLEVLSGKKISVSENDYMFKNVKLKFKD